MPSATRLIPLIIASALFMENMDQTIIATSLPAIAADLGTSPIVLKLAFTTYLLSLTVFIPISGWLADRFGARHVFRVAIAVFTLGSVACGLSSSLGELVAARALQGLGGAMMVPVGRIILLRAIPKAELVDALAWLTIPALLGPLLGPPVGGFITDSFGWRWIFWMNVPFGIAAILLATWLMPETGVDHVPPLDVRGFLLSGLGLSSLIFGLTVLGRDLLPAYAPPLLMGFGLVMLRPLLSARPAHRSADPRFPPAAHPHLPGGRPGRQPVPHRGRRGSLPSAADVPAGLWPQRLRVGHDHLRRRGRRHLDEVRRGPADPALRLPPPAAGERRAGVPSRSPSWGS